MSIASTANRNDYVGNSSASVFPYGYRIFVDTDLKVTVRQISTGTETLLVKGTDYTVSGAGSASGGNVTLVNNGQVWLSSGTLATGYVMTIRRVRPITQTTDIRNQGDFFPETHEDAYDHDIMVAQQLQTEIDLAVKLPESVSSFDPTLPANIGSYPGAAVVVNALGSGFTLATGQQFVANAAQPATYATLKAAAVAAPNVTRFGYATDIRQLVFYTTDLTIGDQGWIVLGGG